MPEFQPLDVSDSQFINSILKNNNTSNCEYCFGNIYPYLAVMDIEYAYVSSCLIIKCIVSDGLYYMFPAGKGNVKSALDFLVEDAEKSGLPSRIYAVSRENAELFRSIYGEKFKINENRDSFDYIYNSSDLINLSGKKYQPKRNHISYFKRNFNWKYEKLSADNIPQCLEMSNKWLENQKESPLYDELVRENKIIRLFFKEFSSMDCIGGVIKIDGEVVAYTVGERLNSETFCLHFEKAYSHIRGAYPMINQQFAENELSGYLYINREEDTGAENLRKAKLSYHPAFLLEKYEIIIR